MRIKFTLYFVYIFKKSSKLVLDLKKMYIIYYYVKDIAQFSCI